MHLPTVVGGSERRRIGDVERCMAVDLIAYRHQGAHEPRRQREQRIQVQAIQQLGPTRMQPERCWLTTQTDDLHPSAAEIANGRKSGEASGAAYRDPNIPGGCCATLTDFDFVSASSICR